MVDIIISGSDGFIGQALSSRLKLFQFSVYEITRADGNIEDAETWLKLPAARTLIHLAGRSFVPDSWESQADFLNVNVIGTQNAINFCIQHKMKMIYVSAYLYGIPEYLPITENHPIKPNNPYALSKFLAEQLCEFSHTCHGLSVVILRLFNVYGPGQRSNFLIPSIFEQILGRRQISVNDLEPKRDYVYIDDVVEAIILADQNTPSFSILNIGSGCSISVRDVIRVIQKICGTALPVKSRLEARSQEIPDVVADIALAHKVLGWKPRISFNEGIEKIFNQNNQIKGFW